MAAVLLLARESYYYKESSHSKFLDGESLAGFEERRGTVLFSNSSVSKRLLQEDLLPSTGLEASYYRQYRYVSYRRL